MKDSIKKNTLSLAVILALQAMSVHAEDSVKIAETAINPEKKQDTSAAKELSEVNVKSTSIQSSDGYQATKTRVGKVLQEPHDIPQAVTTITNSLIKDQQLSSLREALSNVAGLTFNAAEGGRAGDNMMLRGFYTFGDIYLDGIRDTAQYNRELFNIEQVDVLRGSAAMLFGRGQAGGVINQVSKMAKLKDENKVTASIGSYSYHQGTADFNKVLNDDSAIRINLMDRAEENYRKNPTNGDRPRLDRQGIALSFGNGIGTYNEFFLNHVTTKTNDDPDFGVSFVNKRPINKTIGTGKIDDSIYYGGSQNFDTSNTSITTAIFTHKFSENTQLRTQLRDADYERAYWAQKPSDSVFQTSNFSQTGAVTRKMHYQTQTLQSDFSTKFDLAGFKHQFLGGIEYLKEKNYRTSLKDLLGNNGQTNVQYYLSSVESTNTPTKFDANNYAVYAQDTITIAPKWDVLFGLRRDELRADYSSATSPKLSYGENSYRSALSYHYAPETHYYLSWSDSFSPTADLYQLTVAPMPAERSKTLEAGAKWLFFDGDLAFRTALYRTTKDWERNTDLESTAAILTKKRRTDGLEFELAGRINDKWEVFSGLAFMDAKILEVAENVNASTGAITSAYEGYKGQRARNTPPVTFNIWSTYKLTDKWKFALGLEAKGERFGYVPSSTTAFTEFSPNTLPGYVRLDSMLAYEEKKWAVKLNVKNLLDKVYYDAIYDNGGFSVPGNSRTVILTTELKF